MGINGAMKAEVRLRLAEERGEAETFRAAVSNLFGSCESLMPDDMRWRRGGDGNPEGSGCKYR